MSPSPTRRQRIAAGAAVVVAVLLMASNGWTDQRESLLAEGERALLQGNAFVADQAFTRGMARYPEDPRFAYYGAIAAYLQQQFDKARERFRDAASDFPDAHFYTGLIALEQGDPEAAHEALRSFLDERPRDPRGELLLGLAQLQLDNPAAPGHFNLAARLDPDLRSPALFYRGLAQFRDDRREAADKALRAVVQLDESPRLVELAEQTLDLMRRRGDAWKSDWGEVWLDVLYDDNLLRELDRDGTDAGVRTLLKGRYWTDVLPEAPRVTVGGWADVDVPVTAAGETRFVVGGIGDLGFYRAFEALSIDPGVELEPSLVVGGLGDGFGLRQVDVAVRPRLYLFGDHARSAKLFYELGYRYDAADGFRTGLRHRLGLRSSWTGFRRRTYLSALVAYRNEDAAAAAYRRFGPEIVLNGQGRPLEWLHVEALVGYTKWFYRFVRPRRDEDVLRLHGGVGWIHPEQQWLVMAGSSHEYHVLDIPDRNWRARTYSLRVGRYF